MMKKLITWICLVTLCLSTALGMISCGKKNNDQNTTTTTSGADNQTTTSAPTTSDTAVEANNWDGVPVSEIVKKLVSIGEIQVMMPELLEITPDVSHILQLGELEFAEGAMYIPMISSQRFDLAVFRVKEGTDAAAFAADLKKRNSEIQWMCAAPPDLVITESLGDVVLYLSINSSLANGEAIHAGFLDPASIPELPEAVETFPYRSIADWYDLVLDNDAVKEIRLCPPTEINITDLDQLKYYAGLKTADDIEEAYYVDAMITSVPFGTAMVRVKEGADVEAIKQAMLEGVNPQKWICVSADKVITVSCGNVIFMAMSRTAVVDALADSFVAASEGANTEILVRNTNAN